MLRKSHGQRSLQGHSPGVAESRTQLSAWQWEKKEGFGGRLSLFCYLNHSHKVKFLIVESTDRGYILFYVLFGKCLTFIVLNFLSNFETEVWQSLAMYRIGQKVSLGLENPKETFWPTQYVAEGESFRKDGLGPSACLRHIHQGFIFWGMDQMPEPQIILPRSSFFLIKDRYMSYIYHIFSIGNLCLPDWELEGQWFLAGGKKLKIPGAEVFRYLIIRLWELSGASRGTDR